MRTVSYNERRIRGTLKDMAAVTVKAAGARRQPWREPKRTSLKDPLLLMVVVMTAKVMVCDDDHGYVNTRCLVTSRSTQRNTHTHKMCNFRGPL